MKYSIDSVFSKKETKKFESFNEGIFREQACKIIQDMHYKDLEKLFAFKRFFNLHNTYEFRNFDEEIVDRYPLEKVFIKYSTTIKIS